MKNIILIGMMGCGKTTISKKLGKKLNRPVVDIDQYIVDKYQMTISEMFEISEDYFREREHICCEDISLYDGYIVSTGGGVIKNPSNIEVLKKNGIVIYLDRPIPLILETIDTSTRPLLKDGATKLYELYDERHQSYLNACDIHMINDCSLDEIVNKIIEVIKEV